MPTDAVVGVDNPERDRKGPPTQARLILQTLNAVRQSIQHTEREPSKSAVQPALAPVARAAEPLRILDCERASEGLWPEATR